MTFGLLKHFKGYKRGVHGNVTTAHFQHVILGHDLGSILKLMELKRDCPDETVRLVSSRALTRQALLENYQYGPTLIRSQAAVEGIYKRFFNAKIMPHPKGAIFYKEGKFHEFGSRAKSMELQAGEEFFTSPGYKLELSSLFSEEEWENLDNILQEHQEIRIFESIDKTTPTDLVNKSEWLLSFKDFSQVTCENLYVGISPKKFLSLFSNKDSLTPELIDLCASVDIQTGISVTWMLNKDIFTEERTLFIPQSMTHEWGHFIVEFEPYEYHTKTQLCHVLFLIHEDEPQTEDLGSKIKLMKRVLDRVFPDIEQHITKEFIRFDDEMFISDIKERALEQVGFDYPNLKFLGQVSPVSGNFSNEKFLSRTLLSH
ncbi:MAG TPA: hypothetical protein VNJ08_06685 [Bacteriovoracaceae bacterium]|nr:hypothetical protein [Bacteriovoracaceae bacterium]